MRRHHLGLLLVLLLLSSGSVVVGQTITGAATSPPCPPTAGVAPAQDVARGRCLFHSTTAFQQQDPRSPFASCANCHYGPDKTDHSIHLVRVTNKAGQTIEVLRKTPSLLKTSFNAPFGVDGRFASIQEAARGAILSPVEMRGGSVTSDQLDAIAAFILALPGSDPDASQFTQPPAPDTGTLNLIATGHNVFFGKGTCVTCHSGPDFTSHTIATNQVNFTFSGGTDPGAGFLGTGPVRSFKVQSLLFFNSDRPAMHGATLGTTEQVVSFYNVSLNLGLTQQEMVGLTYWLRNCLEPRRNPQPSTC